MPLLTKRAEMPDTVALFPKRGHVSPKSYVSAGHAEDDGGGGVLPSLQCAGSSH